MEPLIRSLNSPANQGNPKAVHDIQRQLQRLQREQSAWQTSLNFLDTTDFLLQFYGALTLGQKVSADWEKDQVSADRQQVTGILERLLSVYVRLSQNLESEVVLTKLSSVLAAIFSKPDTAWAHPIRHVLSCMLSNIYVPQDQALPVAKILATNHSISGAAVKAVLRLSSALQEEIKPSHHGHVGHRFEIQLTNNAIDAWQLIHHSIMSFYASQHGSADPGCPHGLQIQADSSLYEKILSESLQQLPEWTKHIGVDNATTFDLFCGSVSVVLQLLEDTSLAELCMPCVAALQATNHRTLKSAIPDYVSKVNASKTAQQLIDNMLSGYFSADATTYVEFLDAVISQVDCTSEKYLGDPEVVVVLEKVQRLTACQGAAMVEDEVCQTVLEIMTTVAEGYNDWPEPTQFDSSILGLVKDVCLATLVKVQYPPSELDKQTANWDEDEYTRFGDFRFQAKDFFETAFGILGPTLAEDVAKAATLSSSLSWSEFESGLFVLTSVADALSNDPEKCDPSLNLVFSSELWTQAISGSTQVPSRVRRAVIKLLAESTSYLQRNSQFMIASLDFLFRSLHVKALSNQASGAIYSLCDSQREFLVQALPQFLDTMTALDGIPLYARCKVLSGVAALVQALPSEQDRIEPLSKMIELVQTNSPDPGNDINQSDEEFSDPLFERVSMFAAMARGLQSPADTPIDLDSSPTTLDTFWIDGPGTSFQQLVLRMLSDPWSHLLEPGSSDLVAICCDLLRAGFKESHPSPFKFSPVIETDLICALIDLRNSNLDQTMATASCFISAAPSPTANSHLHVEKLLGAVIAVATEAIDVLNRPEQPARFDPPTGICDFVNRCLIKFGKEILASPSAVDILIPIFDFTILLLRRTVDTLPRRTLAAFYASFLELTAPGTAIAQNETASVNLDTLFDKYLPTILGLTVHFLAGECARSEIEAFSGLLRAFISKQPIRSKKILQEAMKPESGVLTEKALAATKPEQRARFIAQVEGLRGVKKTNDIVRDFWISCKGGQFGYVT